jgi:DNA-binding NarL/FixJ family response regulator
MPDGTDIMNRILIVDDYEPWRRHLVSTLGKITQWQIVGEAADGPEAVAKAADFRPDLILLDVGLPTVNGIQAARQILARDPNVGILFISEHQSWEIAEAALLTGARGYVCKSDSGRELAPALRALAEGRRFVAARFGGRVVDVTSAQSSTKGRRHEALYYSTETLLLDQWVSVAEAALADGATFLLVARDSSRQRLQALLDRRGVDLRLAVDEGRYVSLRVDDVLSNFMVGDRLDEARFWSTGTSLMLALARASTAIQPRIVACGECAPTLCVQGNAGAAVQLEELWDELTRTYNLDTFCGFSSDGCRCDEPGEVYEQMRATHTATTVR